jgi:hypothetical protein
LIDLMNISEAILNGELLNTGKRLTSLELLGRNKLRANECKSISEAEWPNIKRVDLST